jgi:hypothetical protein
MFELPLRTVIALIGLFTEGFTDDHVGRVALMSFERQS